MVAIAAETARFVAGCCLIEPAQPAELVDDLAADLDRDCRAPGTQPPPVRALCLSLAGSLALSGRAVEHDDLGRQNFSWDINDREGRKV
jgi:hypothetical protein